MNIPFHPHAYIDISDTIDAKMEAIRSHATQFGRRGLKTEHYREASNGATGEVHRRKRRVRRSGLEVVRMRIN